MHWQFFDMNNFSPVLKSVEGMEVPELVTLPLNVRVDIIQQGGEAAVREHVEDPIIEPAEDNKTSFEQYKANATPEMGQQIEVTQYAPEIVDYPVIDTFPPQTASEFQASVNVENSSREKKYNMIQIGNPGIMYSYLDTYSQKSTLPYQTQNLHFLLMLL